METTVVNKFIAVSYKLYAIENGEKDLFEETKAEHPFKFISGLGATLEDFENQLVDLAQGDSFNFTIPCDKAYGPYNEEHLIELAKSIFEIDGKFDTEHVQKGKIVPLMTSEGSVVNGIVVDIKPDMVVVDLNHPLAGADLLFEGTVIENRMATNEEVQDILTAISNDGCGCGCGSCGDGCGEGCSDEGCGCGHCH